MQRHISYSVSTLLNFGVSGEEEDVKQRERERDGTGLCLLSSHS